MAQFVLQQLIFLILQTEILNISMLAVPTMTNRASFHISAEYNLVLYVLEEGGGGG